MAKPPGDQPVPPLKTVQEAFFGPKPPPTWDANLKRVVANVMEAVVRLSVSAAVVIALVLLLIKLAQWVFP